MLSTGYPKPATEQLDGNENSKIQEIFQPSKYGLREMELRGHSDIHSKQKIKMPLKEKKQKDGARTIRFKKVRRVGPPFSEYLEGAQRQELLEVIKQARATGKTQDEVRQTIDVYLKSHLSAEKLAMIEKVKAEGAREEKERNERNQRNITDSEHQMINRFMNEQRERLNGLLEMNQYLHTSDHIGGNSVDNYLQNVVDDNGGVWQRRNRKNDNGRKNVAF
ncbi:unnamed protein product [Enterobius vermicularis]|uniref:Homeobox domain-containing protein n=1 Tax=Enterobius vermicularis TaxID=51028 RepID=A0A0N4VE59_ENTVE|nr:unnamed protein product [Enterobius vermicularis]